MIICKNNEAGTKVCPMALRSCAGDRCMAWSKEGEYGYCGLLPREDKICDDIQTVQIAAKEQTEITETTSAKHRGRPPKHI